MEIIPRLVRTVKYVTSIQVRGKRVKSKRIESNQHRPSLDRALLSTDPLENGTDCGRQGGSTPSCFCLPVSFLLSPPSFLLLPFLLHHWPLRHSHTVDTGRLLSLGVLCGRPLCASQRRRVLGDLVGARKAVGRSPSHLDRVAPAPPALTGEWFNVSSWSTNHWVSRRGGWVTHSFATSRLFPWG